MAKAILKIPCVILSGGKSSRMGENKANLPFGNGTLLEYQYNRLCKVFDAVYISCKDTKIFEKMTFDKGILGVDDIFIKDISPQSSPIVALYSILSKVQTRCFIMPVDTPFVPINLIKSLFKSTYPISIAKDSSGKTHNLIGFFSPSINNMLQSMLKNDIHKVSKLFERANVQFVEYKNDKDFFNINTKQDYLKAINGSFIK